MKAENPALVPVQISGSCLSVESSREVSDETKAILLYKQSVGRLLNVNEWGNYSRPSAFQLFNSDGKEMDRIVMEGDYIRIDIPGPGTNVGNGYDWVKVELVQSGKSSQEEWTAIRVRPSAMPNSLSPSIAHFLRKEATSTFIVSRKDLVVTANEFARNEMTNKEGLGIFDIARNLLIGTAARLGFSQPQWKTLMDGLLNP